MSSNNINKEFIFNLFLKFYPNVISDSINYNIKDLELEKSYFERKIDAYSRLDTNREVFIESQLNQADEQHLTQIKFIIENIPSGNHAVIIWIAKRFNFEMINEIENQIKNSKKNIEFIAICLNDELIQTLNLLSNIDEFEIIDNLSQLYSVTKFEVVAKFYRKYLEVETCVDNAEDKYSTEKQKTMERILEEIREQMSYFPTVHRERKLEGNILILGGGKSDINYTAGINRCDKIFVELRFHENTKEIFNFLYQKRDEIDDYFDFMIDWDIELYKIYSEQPYEGNEERVIKRQVRILEKLVRYFTKVRNNLQ